MFLQSISIGPIMIKHIICPSILRLHLASTGSQWLKRAQTQLLLRTNLGIGVFKLKLTLLRRGLKYVPTRELNITSRGRQKYMHFQTYLLQDTYA